MPAQTLGSRLHPEQAERVQERMCTPATHVQRHGNANTISMQAREDHFAAIQLSEKTLRAGFVRKVYGILAAQMILTVAVAAACAWIRPIQSALISTLHSHGWAVQFAIAMSTLLSLGSLQLGAKRHYPSNYILLFTFTLSQAASVGYVCAVYAAAGCGDIIVIAFALTAFLFVALTLYTHCAGNDVSYMRGYLSTSLLGLVLAGFVAIFVPSIRNSLFLSVSGTLTFCGYIVYDTWRIEKKFGYDDYISATIELYLDLINLFLQMLKLLTTLLNKGKKK